MNAAQLLKQIEDSGLTVRRKGSNIGVGPAAKLTNELAGAIKRHKKAILLELAIRDLDRIETRIAMYAAANGLGYTAPPSFWTDNDRLVVNRLNMFFRDK